jgi:N-methylhydantoinase A
MSSSASDTAFIGVDVGGTHTDAVVRIGGRSGRGKAFTTYDDFSRGVVAAVSVCADTIGVELPDLLARTTLMVNATTVVTNAITQMHGAKVGVIFTAGFKDDLRVGGGPRVANVDDHVQRNMPDLVDRRDIFEVQGRMDYAGREVVPLDLVGVDAAVRTLVVDRGVTAIAICYLNSHANPAHELAAEERILRAYPDVFVTPSHRASSTRGENRRWTTAVLNCFVHEHAHHFLNTLSGKLVGAGLRGSLAFFQGLGGAIGVERARRFPLALMGAGPAGGAIGAQRLAERLGEPRILLGDMGGTSFETGVLHDGEVHIETGARFGPFNTALNLVGVSSVGAGGGSIASVSERGVPQVGPRSAGSSPGPAVYGNGGQEPTVTDAVVVLGLLDPENYLGGRVELHPELAEAAIQRRFAGHFGWTSEQGAVAIHDLVVVNMANAVREVSVEKGYDPRDFLFLAYGGTLPLFAAQIATALGINRVLIPAGSSVFSAQGVLEADHKMRYDRTVDWLLADAAGLRRVNDIADELSRSAVAAMREEGFAEETVTTQRSANVRFAGQVSGLTLKLSGPIDADGIDALAAEFLRQYRATYGEGTEWKGVPPVMSELSVTATARVRRPAQTVDDGETRSLGAMRKGTRRILLPGSAERVETPIYDEALVPAKASIPGPAVIEADDTTIYVPAGFTADRDSDLNIWLTEEAR